MFLGNDRRNRFIALGLAAVLVAGVVLALLATVAAAAPNDRPASLAEMVVGPVHEHATLAAKPPDVGTDFVTTPAL